MEKEIEDGMVSVEVLIGLIKSYHTVIAAYEEEVKELQKQLEEAKNPARRCYTCKYSSLITNVDCGKCYYTNDKPLWEPR